MRTRRAFRFLLPVAAAVVLVLSGAVERAKADAADVLQALGNYKFSCALNQLYQLKFLEQYAILYSRSASAEEKMDADRKITDYENDIAVWTEKCEDYKQKFVLALTAHLIDVALTEQPEEKPEAKPKPKPKPESTTTRRKPKPEAESKTTRRPVAKRGEEAPAGPSHDPTASALVGIGVGIAIGRGLGGGGGGGGTIGGGGGGGQKGGGGGAGGWSGKGKGH